MSDAKVISISMFMKRVRKIRKTWNVLEHKELWFRGENKKHETSPLRPKLYRPRQGQNSTDPLELLNIEREYYDHFQRCGVQLRDPKIEEDDRDWDWYFLMQHHGVPTRLLDWSDGALMGLHFALKDRTNHDCQRRCIRVCA